jgi:hypothetical protein
MDVPQPAGLIPASDRSCFCPSADVVKGF